MNYEFRHAESCNLCGAKTDGHKVLGRRLNRSQGLRPWRRAGIATTILRCRRCGLHSANPLPVPADLNDHYGVPPEDYWKPEYFEVEEDYLAPQIARFATLSGGPPSGRALDVGSGIGKGMIALEKAGFDAYGVEPSAPFRDRAIERMGRDPRRIAHATVESASFPASHFTLITFGAVLEHLYDPAAALRRALDWLSPGGLIHIEAPSARWLVAKMANLYYRLAGTDYVANLSPMHPPYHLHEFTLPAFRAFCAGTGCEVAHHEDRICSTYLPRLFDPIAKGLMKLTKTGLELEVWLRKTAPAAAGRS